MGKYRPLYQTTSIEAESLGKHRACLNKGGKTKSKVKMPSDLDSLDPRPRVKELQLDPHAAYILTGGLGGLGSSLAVWLAEHGARSLIILSRSGDTSKAAKRLVTEAAGLGCSVVPMAGRADCKEDVLHAVSMAGDKPVKGVVHLAMLLRVLFPQNNYLDCIC